MSIQRWTLLTIVCLMAGCDAGSDSLADSDFPANDSRSLPGRFIAGSKADGGVWSLDFASGHYTPVPGIDWEDHHLCDGLAIFTAFPAHDGELLVETAEDCQHGEGLGELVHAVFLRDRQGTVLDSFGIQTRTGGVSGPARLSPDKTLFALPVDYGHGEGSRLTVFDRGGELLEIGSRVSGNAFDWLPDNRLIYAYEHDIYRTAPASASGEFLFGVSPDEGFPRHLAVSPEGDSLAMVVINNASGLSNYGSPWVVNLDTLVSRRLAHADDPLSSDEHARIEYPTWSPDGQWIALLYGATRTAGWAELFVVPSDADDVLLSAETDEVIPVDSWYSDTLPLQDEPAFGSRQYLKQGPFAWIPVED